MISFYQSPNQIIFVVHSLEQPDSGSIEKLCWLFGEASAIEEPRISGWFKGPRKEMLTPWSTNAVEITQNMGIDGILRIEQFFPIEEDSDYDPMLEIKYDGLDQEVFNIDKVPEPVIEVKDISGYNEKEGLALSAEEVDYLEDVSKRLGRKLTDSEVFGFSQVNSEHCRHKIFNGTFIIDGEQKKDSLFKMIKKTSSEHPNRLISAYKDNVAFIEGPEIEQFAPTRQDIPEYFKTSNIDSVISLKAETHNFPTTVEPFNGAATGSGGEIRDRMAGGSGSIPLAGTAVYMTSYPRLDGKRKWENSYREREWLYQTPIEILIKASNGASDYGNKFGQPLISGSLLTFEHFEDPHSHGFDKVIMLAGGIGFGKKADSLKGHPQNGDKIVVLGGDNYRIGMGGGAVSSVATGEYGNSIELNAIQRSNPEMQKRVYNAIRAMSELSENPIVSIHDHGAGGHLNCLSELVEDTGGDIEIDKLPIGDPTLSSKEIIGNESQERMGLVLKAEDIPLMKEIAERERAPMYVVGEVTGDNYFRFKDKNGNQNPIDLELEYLFGSSPKTILKDNSVSANYSRIEYEENGIKETLAQLLHLEAVACKDWLTNKVDRSVTGKVAMQQCTGPLQLPLNNLGVMALDYQGEKGVATAIGHAPVSALIDPEAGSRLSIAEALTNIIWAPIEQGITGVSLSANWMWPAKNSGEDARLYNAVKAASDFAIQLGLNIPTGKDSLSMAQKYPNGDVVYSPGTVIISAGAEVTNIKKVVTPVIKDNLDSSLWYIDLSNDTFKLGGSSFAQIKNAIGVSAPTIKDASYFAKVFNTIQDLILNDEVLAGHDISAGGMITTLLEMTFPRMDFGLKIDLSDINESDLTKILFSENPGIIIQLESGRIGKEMNENGIHAIRIGKISNDRILSIKANDKTLDLNIDEMRDHWFETSFLLDKEQTSIENAKSRLENYKKQPLSYNFNTSFDGKLTTYGLDRSRKSRSGIKAAIIREKGVNGDREMAYSMHLAGFDVKDVHMTDLVSGREDLKDIDFIVFVGGFSNSDVLGSAKGWAGAFLYNGKAKKALDSFYDRPDTLSLGVCNGCQLMTELGLIYPEDKKHPKMLHNESGKFESNFLNVTIEENETVMFKSLSGNRLGVWVAHGEGKFNLPLDKSHYNIVGVFSHHEYPGNPNGSDHDTAIIASKDGRHIAMMPHLERSIFSWQWPWLSKNDDFDVSPWFESFVNAADWVKKNK